MSKSPAQLTTLAESKGREFELISFYALVVRTMTPYQTQRGANCMRMFVTDLSLKGEEKELLFSAVEADHLPQVVTQGEVIKIQNGSVQGDRVFVNLMRKKSCWTLYSDHKAEGIEDIYEPTSFFGKFCRLKTGEVQRILNLRRFAVEALEENKGCQDAKIVVINHCEKDTEFSFITEDLKLHTVTLKDVTLTQFQEGQAVRISEHHTFSTPQFSILQLPVWQRSEILKIQAEESELDDLRKLPVAEIIENSTESEEETLVLKPDIREDVHQTLDSVYTDIRLTFDELCREDEPEKAKKAERLLVYLYNRDLFRTKIKFEDGIKKSEISSGCLLGKFQSALTDLLEE